MHVYKVLSENVKPNNKMDLSLDGRMILKSIFK
jgi:hypothetical protein